MAAPMELRQKQRAVIEFLVAEGESPVNIHRHLQNVYRDNTLDYSNVCRWVRRLKDEQVGSASIADKPHTGRPSSSVNPANEAKADALIREDRRITLDELAENIEVSHGSAHNIVKSLGFSKVCAHWVPRQLTTEHKIDRIDACTDLLEQSQRDKTFFQRLITGDETWIHHYEPESKRQSMEWRHTSSPQPKKFKAQKSAGKIMATVFWDAQGVILVDFLPKGETINSEAYIQTLTRLRARIQRVRPNMPIDNVLLLHDNARPHTSIRTRETIASFGWTTLPHPPYSPDLAPSDYHLFGPMKEGLRGKHYPSDEEVKSAVKKWLKEQSREFYEAGIHALIRRWNIAVERNGDYVEK